MERGLLFLSLAVAACSCCNIEGNWYDSHSVPNAQLMFRIEELPGGLTAFALTPNPEWTSGEVSYKQDAATISIALDSGTSIEGSVASDCSNVTWSVPRGAVWIKAPLVENVHLVFMNHLDVGYASFIADVLNEYFHTYFPRAIRLAAEAEIWRGSKFFIYTTHPWLISLYLDCPPNLVLNGIKVVCPTPKEASDFEDAIRNGYIAWHAGPMNMQIEFMNSAVLNAGLTISALLDKKYNRTTRVLSQRDVPGMTKCAGVAFRERNLRAVTVGVNPGSAPPAVPKIFKWDWLIALWHPGGYPLNPGPNLQDAGGISLRDCTVAPNTKHALCFAFRTDNSGPPRSLEELDSYYNILHEEFPHAKVFASTLDNFIDNVDFAALPHVLKEIGDTWIQGIASDPRKAAEYRAAGLGLWQCVTAGDCNINANAIDPIVFNATRFLIKLPEHTWGLPGIRDHYNWSNAAFDKARKDQTFVSNEQSWIEQRAFLNLALEASQGHKLHDYITDNLKSLHPVLPDMNTYKEIDPSNKIEFNTGNNVTASIAFNTTNGAICHLLYTHKNQPTAYVYATDEQNVGVFTYHTYSETDFQFMASYYSYYGNAGYDKPNVTANADPESKVWIPHLQSLYQSKTDSAQFMVHLKMDDVTTTKYGAPKEIYITHRVVSKLTQGMGGAVYYLHSEVVWVDKRPTRLPEATMFSYYPSPPASERWLMQFSTNGGPPDYSSTHQPTLIEFEASDVVLNGSQYQHAVDSIIMTAPENKDYNRVLILNSTDIPLVCPITGDGRTPTPFPAPLAPLSDSPQGVAFNLHNNIWNTNYPLYYPFTAGDENFKARFTTYFKLKHALPPGDNKL